MYNEIFAHAEKFENKRQRYGTIQLFAYKFSKLKERSIWHYKSIKNDTSNEMVMKTVNNCSTCSGFLQIFRHEYNCLENNVLY